MPITPSSESEFVDSIRSIVDDGHGLAFLIGSGVSASSGILMGQDFTDFLGYTVYRMMGVEGPAWNLRKDGWPNYPNKDQAEEAREFWFTEFTRICTELGVKAEPDEEQKFLVTSLSRLGHSKKDEGDAGSIGTIDEFLLQLNLPLIPQMLCHWKANKAEMGRRALYLRLYDKDPYEGWRAPTLSSPTSAEHLLEKAVRSLYDWRATLEFLACVQVHEGRPMIAERKSSIIDSFNTYITQNKRPNLSHTMLAHLARPLRTRFLLTTNFDSLIEESFDSLKEGLEVFHVSSQGNLPSYRAVRAQNCLVKMHGGLLETRADFTLDSPPAREDIRKFIEYFCGEKDVSRMGAHGRHKSTIGLQHLLVIGYSGRDQRTIHLIKSVLDYDRAFKVFWICHTPEDAKRVDALFSEKSYAENVKVCVCSRPDLLLYELYQSTTHSLPGGGFSFQYSPHTPPQRLHHGQSVKAARSKEEEELIQDIRNELAQPGAWKQAKVLNSRSGVVRFVHDQFEELSRTGYTPVWLELEDFTSPVSLAFQILQIISLKLGFWQQENVALLPVFPSNSRENNQKAFERHLDLLKQYFNDVAANRWVIFLYARSGAGGCAGFFPEYWKKEEYDQLHDFMEVLLTRSFRVFYLPYSEERKKHDEDVRDGIISAFVRDLDSAQEKLDHATASPGERNDGDAFRMWEGSCRLEYAAFRDTKQKQLPDAFKIDVDESGHIGPAQPAKPSSREHTILDVQGTMGHTLSDVLGIKWSYERDRERPWIDLQDGLKNFDPGKGEEAQEMLQRLQFLYAVTLFRQSRHVTALLSEATFRCPHRFNFEGRDNDILRSQRTFGWVRQLQNRGFLLVKPGGYNWCYRDMRLGAQMILESVRGVRLAKGGFDYIGQMRARTHFWIADWYQKAHAVTGHYIPLIESIFHRFECIRFAPFAKLPSKNADGPDNKRYRFELASDSLGEIVKLLQIGRSSLKFWLAGGDCNRLFSKPGLVHLLDHLRECRGMFEDARAIKDLENLFKPVMDEFTSLTHSLLAEAGKPRGKMYHVNVTSYHFIREEILGTSFQTLAKSPDDHAWRTDFIQFFEKNGLDSVTKGPDPLFAIMDDFLSAQPGRPRAAADDLRSRIPKWRANWYRLPPPSSGRQQSKQRYEGKLRLLIWSVSELAYYHLRRAKILAHSLSVTVPVRDGTVANTTSLGAGSSEDTDRVLRHWTMVSCLCWLAVDLCRSLGAAHIDFENQQKVKCNTIYGMALGYLGRFSEAHRRLNEAHAIMSRSKEGLGGMNLALLHLRRAEVYLSQAEVRARAAGAGNWGSPVFAFIDDAWVCLEAAGSVLSGLTHHPIWWGRLYSLQIRAISLFDLMGPADRDNVWDSGRMPLPFRQRMEMFGYIRRLYIKCLLEAQDDSYRTVRVLRYFFRIHGTLELLRVEISEEIRKFFGEMSVLLDEVSQRQNPALVAEFCGKVRVEANSSMIKAGLPPSPIRPAPPKGTASKTPRGSKGKKRPVK